VLWYPSYKPTTQQWGLTPLQDQQLGGVIMWVPSALAFIVIGLVLFTKWLAESDRRLAHSSLHAVLESSRGEQP
jgi:cytochrome c oxidase assembly factor CtaG